VTEEDVSIASHSFQRVLPRQLARPACDLLLAGWSADAGLTEELSLCSEELGQLHFIVAAPAGVPVD